MKKWLVDQSHSAIGFEVKHMMISTVSGQFGSYTATIEATNIEDLTTAAITFKLDTASINTYSHDRDNHLKSADFFHADAFPKVVFISTSIERDLDKYQLHGDLTIKGQTKPVTFDVKFSGKVANRGLAVYGFEAETMINREDFQLTWNAAIESGGVLVDKKVKIKVNLQVNPE